MLRILVPFGYMIGLFLLSSIPGTPVSDATDARAVFLWLPPRLQNLLHVPVYAALAWLWHWTLRPRLRGSFTLPWLAFIITAAYGAFDEWYQSHVPGRYGSFTDLALNITGALLAVWLITRQATSVNRS